MASSSVKNNSLPPGLMSNLQQVLNKRGGQSHNNGDSSPEPSSSSIPDAHDAGHVTDGDNNSGPVVLVTNGDGIESPGLAYLVEALVSEGLYNVNVCAPQSDKSASGHGLTLSETVAVTSTELNGATAYEVSGTPADCVSLALSGALFSWSKPALVISGINRGSSCGLSLIYSGVIAGAREALISGVPSICISLDWNKDTSQESNFKDAITVCFPLIKAAIRDIEKGVFPDTCMLKIEVPVSPLTNKGYKLTNQSLWRSIPNWQAISSSKMPAGRFMANQQGLGMQLAQLGRDASAAGAARRLVTQKKDLEVVESVGVAGKSTSGRTQKYFRLEFLNKGQGDMDEDSDFRALENGFIAVTPLSPHCGTLHNEPGIRAAASDWISATLPHR